MTQYDQEFEGRQSMETGALAHAAARAPSGLCRRLAPEDVRAGQFVAVLSRQQAFWRYDTDSERYLRDRVVDLPDTGSGGDDDSGGRAGAPLRVLAVALPFVVVRALGVPRPSEDASAYEVAASRPVRTLDLRQVQLAEVGREYAWAFTVASRPEPSERGPPQDPSREPAAVSDTDASARGSARRFRKGRRRE